MTAVTLSIAFAVYAFGHAAHNRLKEHPFLVRHRQVLSQRFIFLLPKAAVLPGSDAGSDEC